MISVCMASYNGERFIEKQLDSVLKQLGGTDELIISDDRSTDQTRLIIKNYQKKEPRIKLLTNSGHGVIQNFETAIKAASQNIIFLCDQDDLWAENKVEKMLDYFAKNPQKLVIMSDLTLIDHQDNLIAPSYYAIRGCRTGFWKNIVKSSYIGCSMAFRSELKEKILPIPENVPMHDMWIGLLADYQKKVLMVPDKLTYYRRHEANVTGVVSKVKMKQKIKWRMILLRLLLKRILVGT